MVKLHSKFSLIKIHLQTCNLTNVQNIKHSLRSELMFKLIDAFLDRLVILGNHRDSWNFGAADATSGSAALMEISRSLGDLLKRGKLSLYYIVICVEISRRNSHFCFFVY